MTEEEQKIIKQIIEEEEDIKKLEQIRKWITERAKIIQEKQNKTPLSNMNILLKPFSEFIEQNLTSKQKKGFKIASITIAITNYQKLNNWRDIKVYHAIGIGKNILKNQKGVGKNSIEILEQALNQYGFSLTTSLTEDQQQIYQNLQKEKVITK